MREIMIDEGKNLGDILRSHLHSWSTFHLDSGYYAISIWDEPNDVRSQILNICINMGQYPGKDGTSARLTSLDVHDKLVRRLLNEKIGTPKDFIKPF
jgi:hypothetical protein